MSILAAAALAVVLGDCASYSGFRSGGYRSYSSPSYSRQITRPAPATRPVAPVKPRAFSQPSVPRSGFRDTDPNIGNPQYMIYPWWLFMLNNHPLHECDDKHTTNCRLRKPIDKVE